MAGSRRAGGKQRKAAAADTWAGCKKVLAKWPRTGVVALVQELYRLSDENRRFLRARLFPERQTQNLDAAEKLLRQMITPDSVWNDWFRHADAKRVVDQYQKATDDPAGVARLLLADLAISLETFEQIGEFDPLVPHIDATMLRLDKILAVLDPAARQPLLGMLSDLAARWADAFGYGLSDELAAMARDWRERIG